MNVSNLVKIGFVVGVMGVMTGCASTSSIIDNGAKNNRVTDLVVSSRDKIKTDGTVAINIDINASEKGGHVFDAAVIKENLAEYLAKRDIKLDDNSPNKYTLKLLSFTAVEPSQYKKSSGDSAGSIYSTVSGQSVGSATGILVGEALLQKMFGQQNYYCTVNYEIVDAQNTVKTNVKVTDSADTLKNNIKSVNDYTIPLSVSEFFVK